MEIHPLEFAVRAVRFASRTVPRLLRHPEALLTLKWIIGPRRTNWEVDEPWWTQPAIAYVALLIRPNDMGFEWGSGGSTVWLVSRGVKITSIEHDQEWVRKVRERCPQADVEFVSGTDQGVLRSEPQLDDK